MANEKQSQVEKKETWWSKKTPGKKVFFIFEMVFLAACLFLIVTFLFARTFYGNEIADAIYGSSEIPNGFVKIGQIIGANLITVFFSLAIIALTWLFILIATFIVNLASKSTKRSRTIGSIVKSVIKYFAILGALAGILILWGVDVTGIVASLGILTLIIGLGCQSLIQDVISGLFIVFDDYFSVGDMVIIDGFRGYVTEIGLRSVKLDDKCGNIKTIANNQVSSCVNLSRNANMISITMPASYFEDVERVEAVFARELPLVAKRMPQILDGITYKGISDLSDAGVEFNFSVHCLAENRFQVKRDLIREIYQMFNRNNICIPFNQITVNNADSKDTPVASEEDKKLSKGLIDQQREIKQGKKKTKFVSRVKQSFETTMKEVDGD